MAAAASTRLCGLCVALALAGCAGATPGGADDADTVAEDPGYSATDARIVETGPDGQPRYTLRAATIRQDPASLEVSLRDLSMQLAGDGSGPWTLSARGGLMPEDASRIDLRGDVRVAGALEGGGEPIEIRSEALRYEFALGRASSGAGVTVRLTGKWLRSDGIDANLKQQRVRLESNVHGRFVP